ncbi:hypothetical protein E2562_023941 [Oryza meyeriana var. granulata]|uniref:Uncharacterized protein n=1 Tax=Oryza meyeriana var. granulata TaxID=110450 RepID=A0A6G1C099_9ORYZ|nr:hypothetical protein E2562_023941 [Oryza meyeriana var. granulata]
MKECRGHSGVGLQRPRRRQCCCSGNDGHGAATTSHAKQQCVPELAAYGHDEQLPDVCTAERASSRVAGGGAVGCHVEAVEVGGVDDVVAPHEGSGQEKVDEVGRRVPRELGVQQWAILRQKARPEVGALAVHGVPRGLRRRWQQLSLELPQFPPSSPASRPESEAKRLWKEKPKTNFIRDGIIALWLLEI